MAKTIRPYLTTAELLEAAHVTRKTLRGAEESGFLEAAYVDDTDYYKYWSIDQLGQLRLFGLLRTGGVSRREISEAAGGESHSFLELAYSQSVEQMRSLRRTMRAIAFQQGRVDDFRKLGNVQNPYVSYQPTRWLALIPACRPDEVEAEVSPERFVDCFLELQRIVEVVGWASSFLQGILTCYDADDKPTARFAYMELVCPPGVSMYGRAMDCGCYRAFDSAGIDSGCTSQACHVCSRFGRKPTDSEAKRWAESQEEYYPWRISAFGDENAERTAFWKQHVQEGRTLRAKGRPSREPGIQDAYEATTIARPCLMPHEVMLPKGVTACALPAGVYFNERFETSFDDANRASYLAALSGLPRKELVDDLQSFEVHGRPKRYKKQRGELGASQGPFAEPFVATHHVEDPMLSGWHAEISEENKSSIYLMTNAGLVPKGGYCIMEKLRPDGIGTELSALVSVENTFF